MSTVLPATSLREEEAYSKARGGVFSDAPVFGRQERIRETPSFWIMAGGEKGTLLKKLNQSCSHLGQNRSLLWQERKRHGHEAGGKPDRCVGAGKRLSEGTCSRAKRLGLI